MDSRVTLNDPGIESIKDEITYEIDRLYIAKFKDKVVYTFHKLLQSEVDLNSSQDDELRLQTNKLIDKMLVNYLNSDIEFQGWIFLQLIRMAKQEDLILPSDPPGDMIKVISHIILFYRVEESLLDLFIEAISVMESKYLISIIRNIRIYLKQKRDSWIDYEIQFSIVYIRILSLLMRLPLPLLRSRRHYKLNDELSKKDKKLVIYRKIYQDCWILIFQRSDRVELSQPIIKDILAYVPKVLPFMSNPLIIADVILSSFYDCGDVECNVLALISLFYIATNENLSVETGNLYKEKGFYSRLYDVTSRLLDIDSINNELHGKILQLIRECVSSGMIPGIYAIKFVKKLVQLACLAPSYLSISLLSLAYSLFNKHYNICKDLIHIEPYLGKLIKIKYYNNIKSESIDSDFINHYNIIYHFPNELNNCLIKDGLYDIKPIPYLWELNLLAMHFDKNVSTLANGFVVDKIPKKMLDPLLFCDPLFSLRKAIMNEIGDVRNVIKKRRN